MDFLCTDDMLSFDRLAFPVRLLRLGWEGLTDRENFPAHRTKAAALLASEHSTAIPPISCNFAQASVNQAYET